MLPFEHEIEKTKKMSLPYNVLTNFVKPILKYMTSVLYSAFYIQVTVTP